MSRQTLMRGALVVLVLAAALVGLRALSAGTQQATAAAPVAVATPTTTVEPAPSDSPTAAASVTPAATPSPPRLAATPKPLPTPKASPKDVAGQFVAAWMNTSGGKKAWLARLRPLVNGELYDGFSTTDITRVPQALVGHVKLVSQAGASAVVIVATSNGPLQITLAQQPQGWVVTSVDEAAP